VAASAGSSFFSADKQRGSDEQNGNEAHHGYVIATNDCGEPGIKRGLTQPVLMN
jgi:hypothetical protein